jgi:integrase
MSRIGRTTAYPGVLRLGPGRYLARGEWKDPKTGKTREYERVIEASTTAEAARLRDAIRLELAEGQTPRGKTTVRDFAESWLRSKLPGLRPSTRSHYATMLGSHIVPAFGDFYIDAVTRDDVIAWRDRQVGEPASINGRLRVLRTLYGDAAADLHIPNPTARVSAIRDVRDENDHKVLAAAELRALLEQMRLRTDEPHWYALALTLATTGMRFGEASALKWDDIDEAEHVIRVRRAHWHGHVDLPKTNSTRTVPLAPELAAALKVHRRHLVRAQAPGLPDGWVFPSATGGLSQPSVLRKPMAAAAAAAKLKPRPSAHWFRHTLNDLLRRATTGEVQRSITGHVTKEMSEHYSHVDLEEKRTAIASVFRVVSQAGGNAGGRSVRKKTTR